MTRSDRLAEPVSLVYDSGRVRGIATPPYWIDDNGNVIPVAFQDGKVNPQKTTFFQYGGFSCNVNDNGLASVGYTLGYENAPWLFVQTANVFDREAVDGKNSFVIRPGQTVCFPMVIYDYEGEDERAIYKALEHAKSRLFLR